MARCRACGTHICLGKNCGSQRVVLRTRYHRAHFNVCSSSCADLVDEMIHEALRLPEPLMYLNAELINGNDSEDWDKHWTITTNQALLLYRIA